LAVSVQLISAVLGVLLYRRYGVGILLPCAAVEITVLLAVAVIDLEHRLIPTLLIYPTVLFALAYSPAWPNLGIVSSLLGGALAFALFFGLAFVARVTFGEGALGDGDVTLAALIGVITGYPMVVVSLALGALFGGLGAILLVLLRRTPFGSTIPYGPFLVAGVIYILLIGNTMHPLYGVM
jgi:leader peptidase (prepilin peptidase)/N-methyltransferase